MELPIELHYKIHSFINDTKTYKNCRLVCKNWYFNLRDIKVFKNKKIFKVIKFFNKKNIYIFNINDVLIEKTTFFDYGVYEVDYFNFNNNIIKKINSIPPFKLKITYFKEKENISYISDIRDNTTIEKRYENYNYTNYIYNCFSM
tara:strand:- start:931 stop:1365 length:435 start_codon:yes stop_codon:yes gene_type:complete